ncbi:MAG: TspO/MBR family protein [Caldimonas sp.]
MAPNLPSSGRSKGRFAPFGLPLMSNVRLHSTAMTRHSIRWQALWLLAWLGLVFVAAAAGALASVDAASFYLQLNKPAWAPPASAFGPVWSVLYALMGVSAWLVWRERGNKPVAWALSLFIAQLVANALWSWLFFAWRLGAASFGDVLLLLVLIVLTLAAFLQVTRLAALLMVPYLAWVCLASALTWAVWQANPTRFH